MADIIIVSFYNGFIKKIALQFVPGTRKMNTVLLHEVIFFPLIAAFKATGGRKQIPYSQVVLFRIFHRHFMIGRNRRVIIFSAVIGVGRSGKEDWLSRVVKL